MVNEKGGFMPWEKAVDFRSIRRREHIHCRCRKCVYHWDARPREPGKLPKLCPNCHSPWWDQPSPIEQWSSKYGIECRCQRPSCRHLWISINGQMPKRCPKCHNLHWGKKPRKYNRREEIVRPIPLDGRSFI
jgi:hypothetical protein